VNNPDYDERQSYWASLSERIRQEEDSISFDRFGYDHAWELGARMVTMARERGLPIAIAVMFGQQRVFHAALAGSSATNDDWLQRKFAVVAKHDCSSYALSCRYRATGIEYHTASGYPRETYALAGGAVPLRVRGSLIGAVGVSGLEEDQDHALVIEMMQAYSARPADAH
jgi:uncharacterized protein (UPF0303 family)